MTSAGRAVLVRGRARQSVRPLPGSAMTRAQPRQRREPRLGRAGLAPAGTFEPHPQVEPRRLAGDRIGVERPLPRRVRRQALADEVVQQKTLRASGASASRLQAPARLPIAFQVQTVSRCTPSIVLGCDLIAPLRL